MMSFHVERLLISITMYMKPFFPLFLPVIFPVTALKIITKRGWFWWGSFSTSNGVVMLGLLLYMLIVYI